MPFTQLSNDDPVCARLRDLYVRRRLAVLADRVQLGVMALQSFAFHNARLGRDALRAIRDHIDDKL